MEGNNTMTLNQATMKTVVQYYFTNVLFATGKAPTVSLVKATNGERMTFEVETSEQQA